MALPSVARTRTIDPEVPAQAVRRRFSAQYKLKILAELDNCKNSGEVGALLRREGLYSSHLTKWRRQREEGALSRLEPQKRGRKQPEVNPLAREVARLQKENNRLQARLKQAETIIEVQKKVSQLLGITLRENGEKS
jgi:transposase-like protein